MRAYVSGLILTMQFFSMIPIHREIPMEKKNLRCAIQMFPLFGMFLGGVYVLILYGLGQWTPLSTLAIAFILWLLPIIVTGGIHLDAVMDTGDAFFSYRDQKRRLEIMKDSRVGAFGVLCIIVFLATRFLFIYEIVQMIQPVTYLLLFLIPVFSRMVMGMALIYIPTAKKSGLGYLFQTACTKKTVWGYGIYLIVIGALLGYFTPLWTWMFLLMVVCMMLYFLLARVKSVKWFGGITGDVIGAMTEGMGLVLWLVVWVLHYYVTG